MDAHFLLELFSTQQPRRSRIIYAVLKNEMTVSAEYWGLRYNILRFTRVLPELTKRGFDQLIKQLLTENALKEVDEGIYIRTTMGNDLWRTYQREHYQLRWPEVFVNYNVANFAQVMLLTNQVISEWSYANKAYYPMQINQQQMAYVKMWFHQQDKSTLAEAWTNAAHDFLKSLDEHEANQFIATWTGHEVIGLANSQLELPITWTEWDAMIWQRDIYAKWLHHLETSETTPLHTLVDMVARLCGPLAKVQRSLAGLQAGYQEEVIAQQQHLKLGTVREHFLTAAIWLPLKAFPYEQFLTDSVKRYFEETLTGSIDTWRFTMVRMTGDPYEFLVFRLYQIWLTKLEATT